MGLIFWVSSSAGCVRLAMEVVQDVSFRLKDSLPL